MTIDKVHTIQLDGDLSLRNAADICDILHTAITNHDAVSINCAALTGIDVSILQLLVSAQKTAGAAGKSITLDATDNEVLRTALLGAGFIDSTGKARAAEGDFWTGAASKSKREAA